MGEVEEEEENGKGEREREQSCPRSSISSWMGGKGKVGRGRGSPFLSAEELERVPLTSACKREDPVTGTGAAGHSRILAIGYERNRPSPVFAPRPLS